MVTQHDLGDSIPTYDNGKLQRENIDLRAQVLRLKREHAAREAVLRKVLGMVEWTCDDAPHVDENKWCPWCWNFESDGHADDCERDATLRQPAPQADAMLAVVEAAVAVGNTRGNDAVRLGLQPLDDAVDAYRATLDTDPARGSITVPAEASDEH